MAAARSAALDPSTNSRAEPSGNETDITDIASEATAAPSLETQAAARTSDLLVILSAWIAEPA